MLLIDVTIVKNAFGNPSTGSHDIGRGRQGDKADNFSIGDNTKWNKSGSMYKVIVAILFFMLFDAHAYSQITIPDVDSLRIESLKKKLPQLKGAARVDCLNDIAREYLYIINNTPEILHASYYYPHQAYNEAVKIGYKYGEAFALIEIGVYTGRKPAIAAAEKYFQQAISIPAGPVMHRLAP